MEKSSRLGGVTRAYGTIKCRRKAGEADEEACRNGWVKYVTEEPWDVNVLRRRKVEESGDLIGSPRDERVDSDFVEGESCEPDSGSQTGGGVVVGSGIVVPSLAGALEVFLETVPQFPRMRRVTTAILMIAPILVNLTRSRPRSSITEVSICPQKSNGGLLRNGED